MASTKEPMSDDELMALYRVQGDLSQLGLLYERYIHLVYGVCLKYLKSREDAQDGVMSIFEQIKDPLLDQHIRHFKSWLYAVTKNYCLIRIRRMNNSIIPLTEIMENVAELHPTYDRTLDADLDALQKCLKELKEDQQECIRSFFLDRKSYQEVSHSTGYTLKQVKSYVQNGKRNLKKCIEGIRVE